MRLNPIQQLQPLQLSHDGTARREPGLPRQAPHERRIRHPGTETITSPISSSVMFACRSSTDGIRRSCRRPTSKSLKSCAGVIFTAPVPFSGSAYSSPTIGIDRPTSGSTARLPISLPYTG